MGIRYYAYAFDKEMTDQALAEPRSILSDDPLADAWGFEPGSGGGIVSFEQTSPARDMLYLDKAWRHLQALTAPESAQTAARPAHQMFEGAVAMHAYGWDPWVRALPPDQIRVVAGDLEEIPEFEIASRARRLHIYGTPDEEASYALTYFRRARRFVRDLAAEGRGMVYEIG